MDFELDMNVDALLEAFDVPDDRLRSVSYLERQVRRFGVHKRRMEECLPDEPWEREFEFCMAQDSMQLAKYMIYLSHYPIRRYLELGVWTGGTFTFLSHYLRRMTGLTAAIAIDVAMPCKAFGAVLGETDWMAFYQCNSLAPQFPELLEGIGKVDYAFIDAVHKKGPVLSDFANIKPYAPMIGFHDICHHHCPEMPEAWREVREMHPGAKAVEFIDQNSAAISAGRLLQGIGVLHLGGS